MKKKVTTMTFNPPKIWKVLNDKEQLQKICEPSKIINLNEVRGILESTKTYYLNNYGLSMQNKDRKVPMKDAKYQWAVLEGYRTEEREPIIAWSCKNDNGKFGCAEFGTKNDFDSIIANHITSK